LKRIFILFIILVLSASAVFSQYTGGIDDGFAYRNYTQGNMYKGGIDDGFAVSTYIDEALYITPIINANSSAVNNTICFGDSIMLYGSGDADMYIWNSGYSDSTYFFPSVGEHLYTVTGTVSSSGCPNTDTITIFVNPLPNVTASVDNNIICLGDTVILSSSNVVSYAWSNNINTNTSTDNPYTYSPPLNGTYIFTVEGTDNNACSNTASVSVLVRSLPNVNITVSPNDTICFNQEFSFTATGGDSYSWANNVNTDVSTVNPYNYTPLTEGDYSFYVTVTDVNNCSNIDTINTRVHYLPTVNSSLITNVACKNENTGSIQVNVNNIAPPYTYIWNNAQDSSTAVYLHAGTYTVTIIDDNNCEDSFYYTITEPAEELSATVSSITSTCSTNNGTAIVSASGGTPNYTYTWEYSVDSTQNSLSNIYAGIYPVTITDSHYCTLELNVNVFDAAAGTIYFNKVKDLSCNNDSTGEIVASFSGGTPSYIFNWSNNYQSIGQNIDTISNLSSGYYYLTVTDANGCLTVDSVVVSQPEPLKINNININNVNCYGESTGEISFSVEGGTPNYIYNWVNTNSFSSIAENLPEGKYRVEVTDNNNCSVSQEFSITQNDSISISFDVSDASCPNSENGSITAKVLGGVKPYKYIWNDFLEGENISNLNSGEYRLLLTDSVGCEVTKKVIVSHIIDNCLLIPTVITPNNDNYNDTWQIQGIQFYERIEITIFNRWGDMVFSYSGSGKSYLDTENQWNGTWNGKELPLSTFVYILNVDNEKSFSGTVTIVR